MQSEMDISYLQSTDSQVIIQKVNSKAALLADKDLFTSLLVLGMAVLLFLPFLRSLEMHNRPQANTYPVVWTKEQTLLFIAFKLNNA